MEETLSSFLPKRRMNRAALRILDENNGVRLTTRTLTRLALAGFQLIPRLNNGGAEPLEGEPEIEMVHDKAFSLQNLVSQLLENREARKAVQRVSQ